MSMLICHEKENEILGYVIPLSKARIKEAREPVPNLTLHLSHSNEQIFRPNSTVSGHVSLTTPMAITPQAVEVEFWGKSSTWIRYDASSSHRSSEHRHYRDNAEFFTVTFNLTPNPQTLSVGQNYTFPFEFKVPEGTGNTRSDCYKDSNDERWTTHPHPLPPTFFCGWKKDKYDPDIPDNAEISYGITARLILPGVGSGKHHEEPLSATSRIMFQPSNPHTHYQGPLSVLRYPKRFTLSSSSLTGQDPSSIGIRQRLHDRFSSKTPELDFELALEIPDILSSGQEFRFRASFTAMEKIGRVAHIPPILFKILKIELCDFTFFRAPRNWHAKDNRSGSPKDPKYYRPKPGSQIEEDDVYRERKTALNAVPGSQVLELAEVIPDGEGDVKKAMQQAKQCDCWVSSRVPGSTPPSFKSFAITRAYRLKVKLGVEIGEKKFVFETESHVKHLGGRV